MNGNAFLNSTFNKVTILSIFKKWSVQTPRSAKSDFLFKVIRFRRFNNIGLYQIHFFQIRSDSDFLLQPAGAGINMAQGEIKIFENRIRVL